MQLHIPIFTFWALASTGLAAPFTSGIGRLERRDLGTIDTVLSGLVGSLNSLTQKVSSFDGQAINAVPVLDAATSSLKTIKSGTATVAATTDSLGLTDTLELLVVLFTLDRAVNGVTEGLVSKKPQFDQAAVGFVVADQLVEFQAASKALVDAVVSKLPFYIPSSLAAIFYSPILNKLDYAVDQYKKPNAG